MLFLITETMLAVKVVKQNVENSEINNLLETFRKVF
jgi:hypothetical protein